jgi:NitT/TauT family transport system ATP-binding protein
VRILDMGLGAGQDRTDALREDAHFFERVRDVREALHGDATVSAQGKETR